MIIGLLQTKAKQSSTPAPSFSPSPSRSLQNKPSCGSTLIRSVESNRKLVALQPPLVQAKLTIGQPNDMYEHEADQAAEQVMSMQEPRVQRQAEPEEEEEEPLQKKQAEGHIVQMKPVLEARINSMRGGGQSLNSGIRTIFEPRFSQELSSIRIHANGEAADLSRLLGAQAFTVQNNIFFGAHQFQPSTLKGKQLLAHELAHVIQNRAGASPARTTVQRKVEVPKKGTAAGGPQLNFQPAKNTPPCACLVFMHHNESNARLMAQLMYEFCRYNLAIVTPPSKIREIDLPGKGLVDPNELFPRKIVEECRADDKPCEDFLSKNAKSKKAKVVEGYAQRQFFLTIKKCSKGFSLPVVALHNNTIEETASYRKAVHRSKEPLDPSGIKGKTFEGNQEVGRTSAEPDIAPLEDLKEWLLKNVPGVIEKKAPRGGTSDIMGGPLQKGKTNIFLWCMSKDISRCHIGDPERPDNVVWVTNRADFEKLRGTKTNVALQTQVDPKGKSVNDLSSLFVYLEEIVSPLIQLEAGASVEREAISKAIAKLKNLQISGNLISSSALDQLFVIFERIIPLINKMLRLAIAGGSQGLKLSDLRYINIETPQSAYDPSTTKSADLRVESYRNVKVTLATLGLDCCDAKPAQGETESATEKVEEGLREGKLPKTTTK